MAFRTWDSKGDFCRSAPTYAHRLNGPSSCLLGTTRFFSIGSICKLTALMKKYYVYILSNDRGALYTGFTNDLFKRVYQHKIKAFPGYTAQFSIHRLIYYKESTQVEEALLREKQIKSWTRKKKLDLVRTMNPKFKDQATDWYEDL